MKRFLVQGDDEYVGEYDTSDEALRAANEAMLDNGVCTFIFEMVGIPIVYMLSKKDETTKSKKGKK